MAAKPMKLLLTTEILEDETSLEDDETLFVLLCLGAVSALYVLQYLRYRLPRNSIPNYVEDIVPTYYLDDFRRFFRMSRGAFEAYCRILGQSPHRAPTGVGGRNPIGLEKQFLAILWYLGSQETFHKIADRFNITESSFARTRQRIFKVLLDDRHECVCWPSDQDTQTIMDQFERRKGFPRIIGAVDGSHISISVPKVDPQPYVNQKSLHSLILHDLRFLHCSTGFPGSIHDARVVRSDLWDPGLGMCRGGHLLGDGAYSVRRWLMTPYSRNNGHLTQRQTHYNYFLSNSRVVIERAFGLSKGASGESNMLKPKMLTLLVTSLWYAVFCIILP